MSQVRENTSLYLRLLFLYHAKVDQIILNYMHSVERKTFIIVEGIVRLQDLFPSIGLLQMHCSVSCNVTLSQAGMLSWSQ